MTLPTFRRTSGFALAGLLAALALANPPTARAQPKPGPQPFPQPMVSGGGTEFFRALLDLADIKPVRASELNALQPGPDLIVVVLGSPNRPQGHDPLEWARETVKAGGGVLIASDSSFPIYESDNDPLRGNRKSGDFEGETVSLSRFDPERAHQGLLSCPYAVPVSPDEVFPPIARPGRVWGVFRGLNKVATNQPTHITLRQHRAEYRYPLARLPQGVRGDAGTRFIVPPLLAVGGDGQPDADGPGYSFLAVADSSIYINQMLSEPGADNRKLAFRTVEYLRGPNGERKRCVFFENGRVIESFDQLRGAAGPPRPPVPPEAVPNVPQVMRQNQDKLVEIIDAVADKLQTQDALHKMLVGEPGSERERNTAAGWVQGLLVLVSLAVGWFLLRWFFGARSPQNGPPPPNTGAGAASTGPPGVFERRQKELVRRNNVYEPVKALLREFFVAVGAPADAGPRMPTLDVSDEVRKPESLRLALRDLWRLAYGPPTTLTAQRWGELEPYFERLKKAHADGKWRFCE